LCGFLAQVIQKHVIDSNDPNIPLREVELNFRMMELWTRRGDNDIVSGCIIGQITVGNITKSLRIDVDDGQGACSKSFANDIGG
jgi:hypothetical protein